MTREWVQAIAPLLVGLLAGIVATRNARKTPHENLKALVDIRAGLEARDEDVEVLDEAIKRELRHLNRMTRAREGNVVAYIWLFGARSVTFQIALFSTSAILFFANFNNIGPDALVPWSTVVTVFAPAIVGIALSLTRVVQSYRDDRSTD